MKSREIHIHPFHIILKSLLTIPIPPFWKIMKKLFYEIPKNKKYFWKK
jgi:hypothetical protein